MTNLVLSTPQKSSGKKATGEKYTFVQPVLDNTPILAITETPKCTSNEIHQGPAMAYRF